LIFQYQKNKLGTVFDAGFMGFSSAQYNLASRRGTPGFTIRSTQRKRLEKEGRDEPVLDIDIIEAAELGESLRPRALGHFGARYAFGPNL
jgi:hypothetical protein